MMQLWEQGKWKPEDPVTKFLPELANLKVAASADGLDNLAAVSHPPTMHEVMTHTAGFGYGLALNNAVDRAYRAQDVLRAKDMKTLVNLVAGIPLVIQPGDRWRTRSRTIFRAPSSKGSRARSSATISRTTSSSRLR